MKLKNFRSELGLSQTELANLLNFPRYKLSLIEQGLYEPTKEELKYFMEALNHKARVLLKNNLEVDGE